MPKSIEKPMKINPEATDQGIILKITLDYPSILGTYSESINRSLRMQMSQSSAD